LDEAVWVVLAEEPAGVTLQLRVRVAQELELKVPKIKTFGNYTVNEAQQVVFAKLLKVVALIQVFRHEAQSQEVWQEVLVLPDHPI
jgi:hypothetical protein